MAERFLIGFSEGSLIDFGLKISRTKRLVIVKRL